MMNLTMRGLSRKSLGPIAAALLALASPSRAADEPDAPKDGPKGAAVTVLKAAKSCFANIVEASGILIPREETFVRPERPGLKVAEILAEAGDTVTAGQNLARLALPEGGVATVQAPVAGMISSSSAVIGAVASAKGEALFSIIARGEFDLVGQVPTRDISKLAVNQTAKIKIIGAGEVEGKVRRVATTIEPNSQLGQVFISVTTNRRLLVNASGRAMITTGQSCGVSVPLTAILYGSAGTVVQVVRRARIETRRVEIGLMSATACRKATSWWRAPVRCCAKAIRCGRWARARRGSKNHPPWSLRSQERRLPAGVFVGAEADVFHERGRHRGNLFAVGGPRDRDAGLVEHGLDSRLRIKVVEQFGHQHAVLAGGIVGDLARRGRG
jgi:hypothetical protein